MTADLGLADLTAEQWGLVTTAQARGLGLSAQAVARLHKQGALERLVHGVYRLAGTPPSPLDELRAAWLALDPGRPARERLHDAPPIVVSHRSAAAVHRLGDLEADDLEFTTQERKQTRRPDVRLHRGQIDVADWTIVDGLPVTTVLRTVDDLAAAHLDGGHLASVVRDALTQQHVDDQHLAAVLRRHARRYGTPMGDGEALLARLLQESGVSTAVSRATELARAGSMGDLQGDVRQLQAQLAAIQRRLEPSAQMGEQLRAALVDSPVLTVTADLARQLQPSIEALQSLGKLDVVVDSSALRARVAELALQLQPLYEVVAQLRQVAEASQVARGGDARDARSKILPGLTDEEASDS